MKNILIVGMGEIGTALYNMLDKSKKYKIFKKDKEELKITKKIDIMHICVPYSDKFEKIVIDYINKYNPHLTIINSTIMPKTTQRIYEKTKKLIVHSPVRGRHPKLEEGLLKFIKFIGPTSKEAGQLAKEHFGSLGIKTEILSSAVQTELGKLLSTTYYAINIAFHQEMNRICNFYNANFKEAVTRFNETCTMDIEHKIPRPIMFPGFIGGHCLMPNIDLLKKDIKSDFLDAIENSNKLRKKELEKEK